MSQENNNNNITTQPLTMPQAARKNWKFEVVIAKIAIYVLTEVRHGFEVAIGRAAAISNGHCTLKGFRQN